MWGAIFDTGSVFLSAVCCAIAVKLTDDYLDRSIDDCSGEKNWDIILGSSSMVYAVLSLVIAATFSSPVALPLFMASYIIGMFNNLGLKYPSGLTGLQESLAVLGFGVIFWGWRVMTFSLTIALSVQLFDDVIDRVMDAQAGLRNYALRFGIIECLISGTICLIGSWYLEEKLFFPVIAAVILVYFGNYILQEKGRR